MTAARLVAVPLVAATLAALSAVDAPRVRGQVPPVQLFPDNRPNVLIIVTDDQRADSLEVMRRTQWWFGVGGTTFDNAYATTPVCCPSRASIMTGRYAHNHGVKTNDQGVRLDQRSTLQRYLHDEGYLTAIAGKFLNDWKGDPPHFDKWSIFASEHGGYYKEPFNTEGVTHRVRGYSTDYVSTEAVRFLRGFEERDDRPWLMYVTPYAPHAPFRPARRHLRTGIPWWFSNPSVRERNRGDKPAWVLDQHRSGANITQVRETRAAQIRTLRAADELVDAVMKTVGTLGEDERTMAFFLSDNGFLWGEHGLKQKLAPYTESVRIPFLFRWPGHVGAGGRVTWPVGTIDIVPTVFDAVDITPLPLYPVDGRPLLGSSRKRVLLEFYWRRRVPTWASTRTETYQYTEWYGDDDGQTIQFREYYDLRADPWQLRNLLDDADPSNDPPPEELARLSGQLNRDRRCSGTAEEGSPESPSPPTGTPASCP